ncbi:LysR family transcriptional regulator [Algihabitans albus]|uniref:LysR family transcriptional regulator n=1 Tax=Algihabitans albus TaxID=2164067 RepID=UPI000E5D862F|nr:LysR family transcriptional regulator [Algihabitans albus]
MDRIAAMRSFLRAVDTGSFTEVAREGNTTQPTVSKQIAALEAHLGVQLLVRTTRSLSVTEEGARYYEAAKAALDGLEAAEAAARGSKSPEGLLRIGCPVSFGQVQLVPRLPAFLSRFPALSVDLAMSDAFLDPVEQGVDLVIRLGALKDSRLMARSVGSARRVTVASPAYVEAFGRPGRPEDLARHDCVLYTRLTSGSEWPYAGPDGTAPAVRVRGRVRADNSVAMLGAVLAGLGVGLMPLWLAGDDLRRGRLLCLLEDYEPQALPIHIVSPPRRFAPPKVTAFVDYIARAFRQDPHLSG